MVDPPSLLFLKGRPFHPGQILLAFIAEDSVFDHFCQHLAAFVYFGEKNISAWDDSADQLLKQEHQILRLFIRLLVRECVNPPQCLIERKTDFRFLWKKTTTQVEKEKGIHPGFYLKRASQTFVE